MFSKFDNSLPRRNKYALDLDDGAQQRCSQNQKRCIDKEHRPRIGCTLTSKLGAQKRRVCQFISSRMLAGKQHARDRKDMKSTCCASLIPNSTTLYLGHTKYVVDLDFMVQVLRLQMKCCIDEEHTKRQKSRNSSKCAGAQTRQRLSMYFISYARWKTTCVGQKGHEVDRLCTANS